MLDTLRTIKAFWFEGDDAVVIHTVDKAVDHHIVIKVSLAELRQIFEKVAPTSIYKLEPLSEASDTGGPRPPALFPFD